MRRALPLALCVLALVAAGCGDEEEETTVTETTTVIETVPTTPAPEPEATTPAEEPETTPDAGGPDGENEDGAVAAPVSCGQIAFEPNTDSGAFDITAGGVGCDTARAVARAARGAEDLSYEAEGFGCVGRRRNQPGLARVDWMCLGESAFVRFRTS